MIHLSLHCSISDPPIINRLIDLYYFTNTSPDLHLFLMCPKLFRRHNVVTWNVKVVKVSDTNF